MSRLVSGLECGFCLIDGCANAYKDRHDTPQCLKDVVTVVMGIVAVLFACLIIGVMGLQGDLPMSNGGAITLTVLGAVPLIGLMAMCCKCIASCERPS